MTKLSIIYARTINGDFSKKENGLPWPPIKSDMDFFKKITTGNGKNAIIMGRNTFESLNNKPLPNRYNIIISNSLYLKRWNLNLNHMQGLDFSYDIKTSLEDAIQTAKDKKFEEVFVIGGINLIYETLERDDINNIYLNIIDGEIVKYINGDNCNKIKDIYPEYMIFESSSTETVLPLTDISTYNKGYAIHYLKYTRSENQFSNKSEGTKEQKINKENKPLYQRVPTPIILNNQITSSLMSDLDCNYESWGEDEYRTLVKKILKNGKSRDDRTGTGTISLFGESLSFDVSKYFPLLTLKKVFWKGVVEELLFFISGKSDTTILEQKGVNIWKGNTSREFLDKQGLFFYKEGELGPGYGYQWRKFGKNYIPLSQRTKQTKKPFQGIDQLQEAINLIKTDPTSRRILVSAWNPVDLDKMALPPCHYSFQFYVDDNDLSILVNMRSCDVFLGLPFNIASYGLLLYIIAHLTNKKPKFLKFMLGDTHIYKNHISQCEELIVRNIKKAPTLSFKEQKNKINEITFDDIILHDYDPHSSIKAEMAV